MEWKFDGNKPVYQQIMQQLRNAILAGEFPLGTRIPSVRELAVDARVNPNTMQRALMELEREDILVSWGTIGRCVTGDRSVLDKLRQQILKEALEDCVQQFQALGLTPGEVAQMLMQYEKKEDESWKKS